MFKKKLFLHLILIIFLIPQTFVHSSDISNDLNKLFDRLKKSNNYNVALEVEMQIWHIWSVHPTKNELTESLAAGSKLMSSGELELAYEIFSEIVNLEPNWAEGWNKRATVLYLMGKYKDSLNDINEVLKLENRHFGALAGQGLVYIQLNDYEKAIDSYKAAQKIYPSIRSSEIMIPQLKELIKKYSI